MWTSWTRIFSPISQRDSRLGLGRALPDGDRGEGHGDVHGTVEGPRAGAVAGRWHWLGRVPFDETAALQERLRADIRTGIGPETLLLLEHDPVITLGRSAQITNVLHSESALAKRGVTLHRASRGGDVTYHGPGQLVGYPLVRLRGGVRAHIEGMAIALAEVLAELGVVARYRREAPGLWVGAPGSEAKICAFGVNVHHRITAHGFALNLDPDLEAFHLIVPCGLRGCQITSVCALRGFAPSPVDLSARVADALGSRLGVVFARTDTLPNCNAPGDP
jgi:lipoyl(octanoyl) transferase